MTDSRSPEMTPSDELALLRAENAALRATNGRLRSEAGIGLTPEEDEAVAARIAAAKSEDEVVAIIDEVGIRGVE